jgi:uncharacterized membrane protein
VSTNQYFVASAALCSAAVGGLFFAFSTFVMKGLDRTPPIAALTAMRGINAEAQANAPFLIFYAGSTLLAAVVGVIAAVRWAQPGSAFVVAGAVCAVLAFVVTTSFNVPLNDHLDGLDPTSLSPADALREWRAYLTPWTHWNHVRTVLPIVGAVSMMVGLRGR